MFYGISWHHCVLNVPWRVQNCHPGFFVIGALHGHDIPFVIIFVITFCSVSDCGCRDREQVNDPSLLTALPAAAPPAATHSQHQQTFKLTQKYSEYHQHSLMTPSAMWRQTMKSLMRSALRHYNDRFTFTSLICMMI